MMANPKSPEVWSDFDGTAVGLVPKHDPRNWAKYWLKMVDGYIDFLDGVREGGVEVAGVVSRRPKVGRSLVTARSIVKLGMDTHFPGPNHVVLAGSETRKAQHLVDRAADHDVGMIDDKPHRLGPEMLDLLVQVEPHEVQLDAPGRRQIVLGAVNHPRSQEYFERFAEHAAARNDVAMAEKDGNLHIRGGAFDMLVVPVQPYSVEAGVAFAADVAPHLAR